jgi:branched-chain amino acid transport system permease protein
MDAPAVLEQPLTAARSAFGHRWWGPVLKVALGYLLIVEGAVQLLFGRIDVPFLDLGLLEIGRYDSSIPRGVFVSGAVIGALYALVGMGLILVYRANRIINFAQAQLGAVPAVLALLLVARQGWNYFAVLPIVVIGSLALGGGVEVAFIRRFSHAPRLILTVVTIGVGFLLLVLEFFTKNWVGGDLLQSSTVRFNTPFKDFTFDIGIVTFRGDHVFTVAVVAVIVIALGAFFRFTDMGIAVRASAENSERASLLGIPVRRVSTVVWMIAALMSAVGVFLRAPLVGLPLTGFVGPSVLLFGLAAAVIARMESLPTAMAAGMLIGIIDRAAVFATARPALANAVMLVVIVIALLAQRGQLSRAQEIGASSWQAVKDFRPIPSELRGLPEVVRARTVLAIVVAALVAGAPFILTLGGGDETALATRMVVYAMVGVSLVILTGWSGQISLGQFAIAGVGAATAGGLCANHGTDFFLTLVIAGLAGSLVAVVIGIPALRIQGLFLAVTTLAFAFTVENFVLNREFFGWLMPKEGNLVSRPILYNSFDLSSDSKVFGISLSSDAKFYYLCLVFLALSLAVASALRRNRSGRILIGVRDNGRALQAYGVNLARTRLAAFAISGFIAAVAGALQAYQVEAVDAGTFSPEASIQLFIMTVIGGIGSLPGAMFGAVFVLGVPLLPGLRDIELISFLTSGVGLLVLLYFLPGGLAEGFYRLRDNFLRAVAAKHEIHVPSLVADSLVRAGDDDEAAAHVVELAEQGVGEPGESVELIGCPKCGARIPVEEAANHAHFQVAEGAGR